MEAASSHKVVGLVNPEAADHGSGSLLQLLRNEQVREAGLNRPHEASMNSSKMPNGSSFLAVTMGHQRHINATPSREGDAQPYACRSKRA
mmetsp:Transcript_63631/g.179574  ORF Transcript_63631/g.179574 Transcript_63631/m.179574 type:complete len:90 (-) Transcript_63631:17-286(-)